LSGDRRAADILARLVAPRPPIAGLSLDRPRIMGIVNVTPDSFSDGGEPAEAVAHGRKLIEQGCDIIDIGGESTRPGATAISAETEINRVLPVIKGLKESGVALSIDTRRAEVMRAAAAMGCTIINDVSALDFDPASLGDAAELGLPVVLMHMQGRPENMQADPTYDDVLLDVYDFLAARVAACVAAGLGPDRIVVDPGIGFGKTFGHNVTLLQGLALYHGLGCPLLVGASRKGFLGHIAGIAEPRDRMPASLAVALWIVNQGAQILRVHDAAATIQAMAVWRRLLGWSGGATKS
jgi:dihydropteroate synthase